MDPQRRILRWLEAIIKSFLGHEPERPVQSVTVTTGMNEHFYGTAWKEDNTASLVYEAIRAGYRAVDTACQGRHYREDLVAQGLRQVMEEGLVSRAQIHIQTKFSPSSSQDDTTIPYNPNDPAYDQAIASTETSLRNFNFDTVSHNGDSTTAAAPYPYLDTVLLHSFLPTGRETLEAWRAMELFVPHRIRQLGICNVSLTQLHALCNSVRIKPAVVQNRFYQKSNYDCDVREFCRENNIRYQAYWVLKKNHHLLDSDLVQELVRERGVSREAALFFLIQRGLGVAILDGTTSVEHMRGNIADLEKLTSWAAETTNGERLAWLGREFERSLGDMEFLQGQ